MKLQQIANNLSTSKSLTIKKDTRKYLAIFYKEDYIKVLCTDNKNKKCDQIIERSKLINFLIGV